MMVYVLLTVGSYLLGSVPFGVLIARAKRIDIMSVGSGNIGATNVARALGWKIGLVVFVLDVAKGAAPPVVAKLLTGEDTTAIVMGVVAVLGHTFSPFLGFKGGKGVATSLGVLFGISPVVGALTLGTFVVIFLLTRIVSLSSLVASALVLVHGLLTGQGWFFFAVFGPLIVYVFVRHRANIQRLMKGEEPKLDLREKLKKPAQGEDEESNDE